MSSGNNLSKHAGGHSVTIEACTSLADGHSVATVPHLRGSRWYGGLETHWSYLRYVRLALSRLEKPVDCAKTPLATFRGYAQSSTAWEKHKLRVDLAAAYRSMEQNSLHECVNNHITTLTPAAENSGRDLMLFVTEGLHLSRVNDIVIFLKLCQYSTSYINQGRQLYFKRTHGSVFAVIFYTV